MQTVDQFFALKVPMRSSELSSLLRGIDNAFQVYANRIIEKFGEPLLFGALLVASVHNYVPHGI